MMNTPAVSKTTKAPSLVSEELASANDVMLAMVRTAKALRIYLPNNSVLLRFVEELTARMAGHIARFGEFRLEVGHFCFTYQGAQIYENRDPKESLAFRIHSDGIRLLVFAHGLEQRELSVFLGIVGFEQPSHQDDDIITQLWERKLPHISYLLEEDFVHAGLEETAPVTTSQQDAISRIYTSIAEHPPQPFWMAPKHLLMLTGDEAKWLRQARQAEAHRNGVDDVINILSAILSGVKELDTFADFLTIASKLTGNMFMVGEVGHALRLVRFLDQLSKLSSISQEQVELIAKALPGILGEGAVQALQEVLDSGETVTLQDLRELLHIFGLPSLGGICELLGRVQKLKARKVIIEVLVELGKENPEVFLPFLADQRWYLVRNVVLVLSLLDTPVALEMIVGLISHKEMRIRREVLGFLERSPDPKAKPYILKYFRDEASALRIRALQILARERHPFALKATLALTASDDFNAKELAERKVVYEVIGELGSERMIPLFRDMLLKKHWFKKALPKDSVVCGVAGLRKMNNSAALKLLDEAQAHNLRNVEISRIIDEAIQALGAGQKRAAADRGEARWQAL